MAKNFMKDKRVWSTAVVVAVLLVVGYFVFRGGKCVTDADCPEGQVCSLTGNCQASTTSDWDNYYGLKPNGKCSDNTGASSIVDPDCPRFCPAGTPLARTGAAGFCCYNEAETRAVDCDTNQPLYQTTTNADGETVNVLPADLVPLQALLTFAPQGQAGSPEFFTTVANTVTWNAPASYPSGITSMSVWLDSVKMDGAGTKTVFENGWKAAVKSDATTVWSSPTSTIVGNLTTITGTANKYTGVAVNGNGVWVSNTFNLDSISLGTYTITYRYCFQDEQGRMAAPQCQDMAYTARLEGVTIQFNVAVTLR